MALERRMSYFTTAKIINMAVSITMAMVRQRVARGGFLVTYRKSLTCSGIRGTFCDELAADPPTNWEEKRQAEFHPHRLHRPVGHCW